MPHALRGVGQVLFCRPWRGLTERPSASPSCAVAQYQKFLSAASAMACTQNTNCETAATASQLAALI